MKPTNRKKPPRLSTLFQKHACPLYFVTFNTWHRQHLLSSAKVHETFISHARKVLDIGVGIGRYMIMPDHIHLFVRLAPELQLGETVKHIKQPITKLLRQEQENKELRVWQPGFFDHLLRSSESYEQKWNYVRENPVRAGLVDIADDWEYQGEFILIDRV